MKIIGVIGGIGTGKSTLCKILESVGGYIISSDEISHRILEPEGAAYEEVLAEFGTVERTKLAAIVFSNKDALARLNQITHKHISKTIVDEMSKVVLDKANNNYKFIVLEVPLPVKDGFLDKADVVWAVTADEDVRIRRLCEQRGFNEADARARIANQPSADVYAALADVVIDNSAEVPTKISENNGCEKGVPGEESSLRSHVIMLLQEIGLYC